MTEKSPLARLFGIETVYEFCDRTVDRLAVCDERKTPTGVVHSGTVLNLADNCATHIANWANHESANSGAFMVLVDLHSSMPGNQSYGELHATSTVVPGTEERRLAEVTTTHVSA